MSVRFRLQLLLFFITALLVFLVFIRRDISPSLAFDLSTEPPPTKTFKFLNNPSFIFGFGDSYTSDGWDSHSDPLIPYTAKTTCDGPVWARTLSRSFEPEAQLVNFAVSGATIDNAICGWRSWQILDITGQVRAFTRYFHPAPRKAHWHGYDSLFTIGVGTNDVSITFDSTARMRELNQTQADAHEEMMDHYFALVEHLYSLGARAFVFNSLGPFDLTKRGKSHGSRTVLLRQSIIDYNAALLRRSNSYCNEKAVETGGDIFCMVYDAYNLTSHVLDHYQDYGFREPYEFCSAYEHRSSGEPDFEPDPSCLGPVGVYVWADSLHPSWRFHEIWANELKRDLLARVAKLPA